MKLVQHIAAAVALCAVGTLPAFAQSTTFQNGSFGTPTPVLTPWTAFGDVSIVGSRRVAALTTASYDFQDDFPLEAGFNNNSGTAAVDFFFASDLAGVSFGSLDAAGGDFTFEGSAIRQDFIATAGDILTVTFDWAFLSLERNIPATETTPAIPMNRDFGFVAVNGSVVNFVDASSAPAASTFAGTFGDLSNVNWVWTTSTFNYTYTAAADGAVSLVLGVVDIGDASLTSELRLDNIAVSAVPEPETYAMLLAGLALMGGAVARRRRS